MRWQEFKCNLLETKQQEQVIVKKAETHLDALVNGAKELPDTDPAKQKVINTLKQVNASLVNFVNKIKGDMNAQSSQPTMAEEASPMDDQLEIQKNALYDVIATFDELYDHIPGAEGQALLEQKLNEIDAQLYDTFIALSKEHKALKDALQTATGKAKEVENFFKGLLPLLRQLGNKVNDYTEVDAQDLADMTSTERKKAKSIAVNAGKFAQTLAEAMSGKVLKLLSEGNTTTDKIKAFLEACLNGEVIELTNLVKNKTGLIDDYVNPKYENEYQLFVKENIFSYAPSTGGGGAIGPGEMALSMLGSPASKATQGGDIYIGEGDERKLYEVKAGKGSSGGRMNSKKIQSAQAGMVAWGKGINNILRKANAKGKTTIVDKRGKETSIDLKDYYGTTHNKTTNKGYKEGSNYNWNSGGIGALNSEILKPYAAAAAQGSETAKDVTFKLFHDAIKPIFLNWDEIPNADKTIYNAIKEDGTVDYQTITKAYTSIAYKAYQISDKVEKILFIRTDTRHFTIIDDHDDFIGNLGTTVLPSSGFTWNDDQQKASPTYLPAKHN